MYRGQGSAETMRRDALDALAHAGFREGAKPTSSGQEAAAVMLSRGAESLVLSMATAHDAPTVLLLRLGAGPLAVEAP